MPNTLQNEVGRRPSLTDVEGILVGHFTSASGRRDAPLSQAGCHSPPAKEHLGNQLP